MMSRNKIIYLLLICAVVLYLLYILGRAFFDSLFVKQPGRINLVVYGAKTAVYSIGLQDNQDYITPFDPEQKIKIPGGYDTYRVGSIGKLVRLDKDPEMYKKTFSLATSSLVHYYFYENKDIIYYESKELSKKDYKLNYQTSMFFNSNANLFDRIYLTILFNQRDIERFKLVANTGPFDQKEFSKRTLGLFYERSFRDEKKSLQMIYNKNYTIAESIASILDGSGIRVSDISYESREVKNCLIEEERGEPSITALALMSYFGCERKQAETEVYDIIFYLGDRENDWEV